MPIPINIKDLIEQKIVENARIEYKASWNPEPILHAICAFANDIDNWGGGYIIIGIEEENGIPKTPIKGLEKNSIDKINKELLQICNFIEPRYLPITEQVSYQGKDIIILWIPGGNNRPYKCPISINKKEKAYYIRKMSNTIKANELEEKELIMLTDNQPFDDRINIYAKIENLKSSLISEFLYTVGSNLYAEALNIPIEEIASSMRLIGGAKEIRKPLNVGLMFFNDRPDNFFRYSQIDVVDKPDPTGKGMTEKTFLGPLDRQLKDALSYIKNYIIKEMVTKIDGKAEAERVYNYPYSAIEETLSNAIYHKSYQIGEPITVNITPEYMEITSLPGPDRTITDEDIKNLKMVSRRYRNRRIGDFLKELRLVEGRNTGIPTILKAMKENGSNPPIFETDSERTYFTVRLPIHKNFIKESEIQKEKPKKNRRKNIVEIKNLILEELNSSDDLSSTEVAKALGYTKLTDSVSRAIKELISEGQVEYLNPDKIHDRNQKILLAEKTPKYGKKKMK